MLKINEKIINYIIYSKEGKKQKMQNVRQKSRK